MTPSDYYVHDFDPIIVRLWGDFGIRYYGLAYVLGFFLAMYILYRLRRTGKIRMTAEEQGTVAFALLLGVLIGGRIGHVLLYDWRYSLAHPLSIFEVWRGGMASHGGFAGVIFACWWLSKKMNLPFLRLGDAFSVMAPPGFMLGRLANFVNGELWGTPTDVPWAVIFPKSAPYTPIQLITPRHPSQLYEAALEGLFLLLYTQWRLWRTRAFDSPGRISGEFLLLYAVVRIVGEQFREPDAPPILGVSRGVFYSLFLGFLGIFLIINSVRTQNRRPPEAG